MGGRDRGRRVKKIYSEREKEKLIKKGIPYYMREGEEIRGTNKY